MRFRKFLLISCLSLLAVGALSLALAPFAVATGLRFWIARTAQQDGLRIEYSKIDAPLLRPVVLRDLKIFSQPDASFQIKIESPRVELALNLLALFGGTKGHVLRELTTEGMVVDIRGNPQSTSGHFAWRTLADLLADNFKHSGLQLHLENGDTTADLRGGTISGAQIAAGVFSAQEINIVSPLFCKSFSDLRGTTSWQENRLSIGALTLTRGLDLDSISLDLSQIRESKIGVELNMDAFGGKIRASVSSDDHADKRTWDVAGTASEISLVQMSEALEFTDRAGGSLRNCKFTFRGDTTNLREATATVWAEVTGLTWRDRTADTIVIGASLYNRQVQIEQVFVKQRANQLTLTGESALPEKLSDWLNPDFRGDISASIEDLGDFARLFGASQSDFAGKIAISGNVSARERKLGGQLMISGKSLVVFRAPVESLDVRLNLKESKVEIENFELCQKNDFIRGQANVDFAHQASYTGAFSVSIAEVADYVDLLPDLLRAFPLGGNVYLDWLPKGTESSHSGTFHLWGQGLHPLGSWAIPFSADLEGEYSPDGFFFRQFTLSNPRASFRSFVTVAKEYLQLQSLRFELNGKPKIQGDIFLPVAPSRLQGTSDWLPAPSDNPKFDVNVGVDQIDLAELAQAILTQPKMWGQVSGNLELRGPLESLDGKSSVDLRNFVFGNEPRISANLEMQLASGVFRGKGNLLALSSDPVDLDWVIPYRFDKRGGASLFIRNSPPMSASIRFPAVFVSKLPSYLSRGAFVDGILSGHLSLSNWLPHPEVTGDLQLVNGRFLSGLSLASKVTFQGQSATVDFAQFSRNHIQYGGRGTLDFRDTANINGRFFPSSPMVSLTPLDPGDCVNGIEFSSANVVGSRRERIAELGVRGNLASWEWSVSLSEKNLDDPLQAFLQGSFVRTYSICHDQDPTGQTLTLGISRMPVP